MAPSIIVIIGLLSALIVNCEYTAIIIYENLKTIRNHWGASTDEKYEIIFGDYYNYIKFIRDNTPPESIILFPPPHPRYRPLGWNWQHSYFLYPRAIPYQSNVRLSDIPLVDYIVTFRDFPGCNIDGEKIGIDEKVGLYKLSHNLARGD